MVQHKGVKVTIVRHHDKQPYTEYKPDKKAAVGHRKNKTTYIEAVSGERFAVVVEILPGFNFKASRQLLVTAAIDECVESSWTIDAKDVKFSAGAKSLDDRQVLWDTEERLIDGKWKSYGFSFAPLKIDDGAELTEEEIQHDLNALGRVTVTVARGKRVACEPYVSPSVQKIEERATSRDLVAKHHVSHTTKLIQLGECEPLLNTFIFHPATSDTRVKGGPPIRFVFRPRSKESLRLLNIKSKRSVLPPAPPSRPGICEIDTGAGTKSGSVHARCDDEDDEEPCPKKSKTETGAGAQAVKLVLKRPHTSPQLATEGGNDHKHKDSTAAEVTSAAQAEPQTQLGTESNNCQEHNDPTAAYTTAAAQVEPHTQSATEGNHNHEHSDPTAADAPPATQTTPHPQPPVARKDIKHEPIVIKDEDEDEETHSTNASPASRTPSNREDHARRERQKQILNNRLKQLKIEQQLLEMED